LVTRGCTLTAAHGDGLRGAFLQSLRGDIGGVRGFGPILEIGSNGAFKVRWRAACGR
jgi:hypothetical protein